MEDIRCVGKYRVGKIAQTMKRISQMLCCQLSWQERVDCVSQLRTVPCTTGPPLLVSQWCVTVTHQDTGVSVIRHNWCNQVTMTSTMFLIWCVVVEINKFTEIATMLRLRGWAGQCDSNTAKTWIPSPVSLVPPGDQFLKCCHLVTELY